MFLLLGTAALESALRVTTVWGVQRDRPAGHLADIDGVVT
jgi:hypothetical protein